MPKTHAEALEMRDLLEGQIISQYDSDNEREDARMALGIVEGIDFETGWPVDDDGKPIPPEGHGVEGVKDNGGEGRLLEAEGARPEGDKPDDAKAEGDKAEGDKPEGDKPDDAERKRHDDELEALRRRNAELEARAAMADAEPEIRAAVSEKMKATLAEHEQLVKAEDARVDKFREEYGDAAAATLRKQIDETRAARVEANRRLETEETGKMRAERREAAETAASAQQSLAKFPDLVTWRQDAVDAGKGVSGKSSYNFDLAVSIDENLRKRPEWTGKTQEERFEEVVRVVKLTLGEGTAGTSDTQKPKDKDDGLKATAKQIEEQIARKSVSDKDDAPESLSDLTRSTAPEDLLSQVRAGSALEIDAMNLPPEKIDSLVRELEEAA